MQESVGEGVPVSEQKLLVARVLASDLFAKSHRLSAFLRFICEQYFRGDAGGINEQRIGTEVFGRQRGYHVGEDSIVRSQARFLRQRLEEYFSSEGRQEPYLLLIPKGSYVPSFERREVPVSAMPVVAAVAVPALNSVSIAVEAEAVGMGRRLPGWLIPVAACVLVVVAIALWAAMARGHAAKGPDLDAEAPAVKAFWLSLFGPERTTLIVPADSTLVLMEQMTGKPVHLASYINKDYLKASPAGNLPLWQSLTNSQYTNMADLNLVARLVQVREALTGHIEIHYARDLSLNELKEANAVLIGGARSNPWMELFGSVVDFDVDHDYATGRNVVRNRAPAAGEQSIYVEDTAEPIGQNYAYGVVVYAPGLDNIGHVLLVEGTSKPGTEAAADFLTSPGFAQFLQKIGASGNAVPNFAVLLSAGSMNGASYRPAVVCWHSVHSTVSR